MRDLALKDSPVTGRQSLNPITIPMLGRAVVRRSEQLRLHPALIEVGWSGDIEEFYDAARIKNQSVPEPVLITTSGIILCGFGVWRLAVFESREQIRCMEYEVSEEESLQFILSRHRSRRGWNNFVRIRLALRLEPVLHQKALENMSAGGKHKGSATLPDVQRIDVRQQIAAIAGVGARNVGNVKTILQVAHPRITEALMDGTLTINKGVQFCKLSHGQQLEQFVRDSTEHTTGKVIRQSLSGPSDEKSSTYVVEVLNALRQQEATQPGSISIRLSARKQSVLLISPDLLVQPLAQEELKSHEIHTSTETNTI
jgi:hypothetical protein